MLLQILLSALALKFLLLSDGQLSQFLLVPHFFLSLGDSVLLGPLAVLLDLLLPAHLVALGLDLGRKLDLHDAVQNCKTDFEAHQGRVLLIRLYQNSGPHEQGAAKKVSSFVDLLLVVDLLVCNVKVNQGFPMVLQDFADVLVNNLVSDLFSLGHRHKPKRLAFEDGVQVLQSHSVQELSQVLVVHRALVRFVFLGQEKLDRNLTGQVRVSLGEPDGDVHSEDVLCH